MSTEPSASVVAAWIRLMRVQQAAVLKIERALREAGLPPYAWYDVLWELDKAGEAGLRPFEIERRILIAQSNISRLIDRLQAAGHVMRCPCEEDGRGQIVLITEQGRGLRRTMWPVYAAAIERVIGSSLTETQAATLAEILGLIESAGEG